jgi:hypothetical protein
MVCALKFIALQNDGRLFISKHSKMYATALSLLPYRVIKYAVLTRKPTAATIY